MIVTIISLFLLFTSFERSDDETICLSIEEENLYEMLMKYRQSKDLPTIPLSASLTKVAQTHVYDLMENYKESSKCNPHSWSKKGDWSDCCYTSDHKKAKCMWDKPMEISGYASAGYEIVAWRFPEATAQHSMEGWQKSKGHNPVMINSGTWSKIKWNAVGIGIYKNYAAIWFGEKVAEVSDLKWCD